MGKTRIEKDIAYPTKPGFFNWRNFDPAMLPGGMNAALAHEMVTYRDRLDELLDGHEGDYVVIKGDEIVGYYADQQDALKSAFDNFGFQPVLIKKILEQEPTLRFSSIE